MSAREVSLGPGVELFCHDRTAALTHETGPVGISVALAAVTPREE